MHIVIQTITRRVLKHLNGKNKNKNKYQMRKSRVFLIPKKKKNHNQIKKFKSKENK